MVNQLRGVDKVNKEIAELKFAIKDIHTDIIITKRENMIF